jgi:hypothetical protein
MQRAVAPRSAARCTPARAPAAMPARQAPSAPLSRRAVRAQAASYTVQLTHKGVVHELKVGADESILEVALDAGLDVPHDCKVRDAGAWRVTCALQQLRLLRKRATHAPAPARESHAARTGRVATPHLRAARRCGRARCRAGTQGYRSPTRAPCVHSFARADGRLHDLPGAPDQVITRRCGCAVRWHARALVAASLTCVRNGYRCALSHFSACVRARSGTVDQSGGSMLSDDVAAQGFVLLCCGRPESDCSVRTVDEARAHAFGSHALGGIPCCRTTLSRTTRMLPRPPLASQEELLAVQMHSGALK